MQAEFTHAGGGDVSPYLRRRLRSYREALRDRRRRREQAQQQPHRDDCGPESAGGGTGPDTHDPDGET